MLAQISRITWTFPDRLGRLSRGRSCRPIAFGRRSPLKTRLGLSKRYMLHAPIQEALLEICRGPSIRQEVNNQIARHLKRRLLHRVTGFDAYPDLVGLAVSCGANPNPPLNTINAVQETKALIPVVIPEQSSLRNVKHSPHNI